MHIFLTGASGYIGSAVLDAFVRSGHHVTGLVRNSEKAAEVGAHGGMPLIGDLHDRASYGPAAEACDVLVHAAFDNVEGDRRAIDALVEAARVGAPARPRAVIYTSGIWVLGPAPNPVAEDAPVNPVDLVAFRPGHERLVLDAAGGGVRTIVVRPGVVYGGARGLVSDFFRGAANGVVRVIGNGDNHWPTIYDHDLADLYVKLALHQDASGIFHATDDGDDRVNDMVEAIVQHAPTPPVVRHVSLEEARTKMGPVAAALALDQIVEGPRARALGWAPSLPSVARSAPRLWEEWRAGAALP